MNLDLIKTISRVRRAMPRNADVMSLCDALEKLLPGNAPEPEPMLGNSGIPVAAAKVIAEAIKTRSDRPKFDRNRYQREYMQRVRKREKENGSP